MILKQVIKYDNAVAIEATWVEQEITQAVGVDGEEGYQPEQVKETVVKSTAYAGNQMDLFRADVAQYGGDISLYEDLIAQVEADFVPEPEPVKTLEQQAEEVRIALQSAIDDKAKSFNFSSGNALMLYAGFINPFQALAQQFAVWEASVWYEAETYRQEVIAGTKPMLTPEEAVALMPVYPS